MVNEYILADKEDLLAIAEAIRENTGTIKKYSVPELSETIIRIIEQVHAGGTILPDLENPASNTDVLIGKDFINKDGEVIVGTMPNNGDISLSIDGIEVKSVTVPEGYTSGGTISLDDTLDNIINEQEEIINDILTSFDQIAEEQEEILVQIVSALSGKVGNIVVNGDNLYVENGKLFIS